MTNHNPISDIQDDAVRALRRYLAHHDTEDLRAVATRFVEAREHFYTKEGEPDWTGRTYAYRRWVREVMTSANTPPESLATVQAAIRYHVGNILRDRLDAEALAVLGLRPESPRERSVEKRAAITEQLAIFSGGAEITHADEVLGAITAIDAAVRRIKLSELSPSERRSALDALGDVTRHLRQVAESSS